MTEPDRTSQTAAPRPTSQGHAPAREEVIAAYDAIAPHVRRTPVIAIDGRDFGLGNGAPILFKLEFLQRAGSFKTRGAFANLLLRDAPEAGVAAASGGNHGAAVAYAANALGVKARIFVPEIASPAKIAHIRACGAELVVAGARYDDAREACEAYIAETGALSVHAFEQRETLMGQGTVALELSAQAAEAMIGVDTILVATGGGGLIGGMAAYLEGRATVIAVEPEAAPTLHAAFAAGAPVDAPAGGVAADSLAPRRIGDAAFALARAYVERSVLVSDDAIVAAQQALWDVMRVASEPGGAAALAALLSGAYRPEPDERVAVLLCGANTAAVDFDR